MAEITEREIEAIHDSHDRIIKVETLIGNGDKGLYHDVQVSKTRIWKIEIILALITGSGILGGGIVGLIKLAGL